MYPLREGLFLCLSFYPHPLDWWPWASACLPWPCWRCVCGSPPSTVVCAAWPTAWRRSDARWPRCRWSSGAATTRPAAMGAAELLPAHRFRPKATPWGRPLHRPWAQLLPPARLCPVPAVPRRRPAGLRPVRRPLWPAFRHGEPLRARPPRERMRPAHRSSPVLRARAIPKVACPRVLLPRALPRHRARPPAAPRVIAGAVGLPSRRLPLPIRQWMRGCRPALVPSRPL